jgi:NitT/TauT family transport system permease protein
MTQAIVRPPSNLANRVPSDTVVAVSPWPGILRRMAVWACLFIAWEAAYRVIGWPSWKFPAPSHVVDALFNMLNVHTAFGDPLRAGWPRLTVAAAVVSSEHWYSSPLVSGNLISFVRLLIGFTISVGVGTSLGVAMWRLPQVDQLLGPLFLGLLTLPSVCWVPLGVLAFGTGCGTCRRYIGARD